MATGDESQPDAAPGWFDSTHLDRPSDAGPRHSRPDPEPAPPPSPRPRHSREPADAVAPPIPAPEQPPTAEATTRITPVEPAAPPSPDTASAADATTKVTARPAAPTTPTTTTPAPSAAATRITAPTPAAAPAAPAPAAAPTPESGPTDPATSATPGPETLAASANSAAPPHRAQRVAQLAGRSALALLSVVTLVLTGIAWATVGRADQQLTRTDVLSDAPNAPQADDGATDILLVGADSRTDAQGRPLPLNVLKELRTEWDGGVNTDTIIVIRVPHNGARAYGVSIPRDTYVSIPGWRDDKINGAYTILAGKEENALRAQGVTDPVRIQQQSAEAGRRALIGAVQDVTGLKIDHYAEVNLLGFYQLTQAIGGVQVCLKHATKDKDSGADFPAGTQNISGGDALSFVRQRKNLPRGDLDRILRQQVFMAALVRKVLSAGTLTDPARLSGLLDTVRQSIVLDKDWDITGFAQQMQGLSAGGVQFRTIPVTNINARDDRGLSIVTVDKDQVHRFVAGLIGTPVPPATGAPSGDTPPGGSGTPAPTTTSGTASGPVGSGVIGDGPAAALAAPPDDGGNPGTITPDGIPCVN